MNRALGWAAAGAAVLGLVFGAVSARANVRHFAYTYESGVLEKGEKEIELWTTWRSGRNTFYSRFQHRLEYEVGLSDSLMTALYLNWRKTTDDSGSKSEFKGLSSEWKYEFMDSSANILDFAGYIELGLDTDEVALEAKLITDKSFGSFRAAYNAVLEVVAAPEAGKLKSHEVEAVHVGGLYFGSSPSCGFGVEGRVLSLYKGGDRMFTAILAGPSFHVSKGDFWATLTVLSQLSATAEDPTRLTDGLELGDLERTNVRLLLSLPL